MHYYQAPDQSLHALDDASFANLLPQGCTEITQAQYTALTTPPAPTPAQIAASYSAAGQSLLDSTAQAWQYNDIASAATYANSTIPKFKDEAGALILWRDQFWSAAGQLEANVLAGTTPMPATVAAFLALMPAVPARPAS